MWRVVRLIVPRKVFRPEVLQQPSVEATKHRYRSPFGEVLIDSLAPGTNCQEGQTAEPQNRVSINRRRRGHSHGPLLRFLVRAMEVCAHPALAERVLVEMQGLRLDKDIEAEPGVEIGDLVGTT